MIQKVFYGNTNTLTETGRDIFLNEKLVLVLIVVVIIAIGVYPQPLLNLTNGFVDAILKEVNVGSLKQ
jgi:NADH-quinone oxidoreductase subunit M